MSTYALVLLPNEMLTFCGMPFAAWVNVNPTVNTVLELLGGYFTNGFRDFWCTGVSVFLA